MKKNLYTNIQYLTIKISICAFNHQIKSIQKAFADFTLMSSDDTINWSQIKRTMKICRRKSLLPLRLWSLNLPLSYRMHRRTSMPTSFIPHQAPMLNNINNEITSPTIHHYRDRPIRTIRLIIQLVRVCTLVFVSVIFANPTISHSFSIRLFYFMRIFVNEWHDMCVCEPFFQSMKHVWIRETKIKHTNTHAYTLIRTQVQIIAEPVWCKTA